MGKAKILVVEDDAEIRGFVSQYLKRHGFDPIAFSTGGEVFDRLDEGDLLILDLNLPDTDGLQVLKRIRRTSSLPILIMSARADGKDRILGLDLGADDYLAKPVLPEELIARVKALLRRANSSFNDALRLDEESRTVKQSGIEVKLTPQEYKLLRTLSDSPRKTFSREDLLLSVWEDATKARTRRVDLIISNIRVKFIDLQLDSPIESVWGVGYRFVGSTSTAK